MVNLSVDFHAIKCDLGHVSACTNTKCKICGESFEGLYREYDENAIRRKERFSSLLHLIECNEKTLNELMDSQEKTLFPEDEYAIFSSYLSTLNKDLSISIFEDLTISNDDLETIKISQLIISFTEYFNKFYNMLFKILKTNVTPIYKNIFNRLLCTSLEYKDMAIGIIYAITASDYDEFMNLQDELQEHIDAAGYEVNILNSILTAYNTYSDIDVFKDGEMNISAIMSMIFSNSETGDVNEKVNELSLETYYYFRKFLLNEYSEYDVNELLDLSAYKYMGTVAFDDERYQSKIRTSIDILQNAYESNALIFEQFLDQYLPKFEFMLRKVQEITASFAFTFGNNPKEIVLMRNYIKWYKDLCEGTYRDSMLLLYTGSKIVRNKPIVINDILDWTGYSDIFYEFENLKKFNLDLMTEGVDKIIRNSEAHVDYDINVDEKLVILRNRNKRKKEFITKNYSFENFIEISNLLLETIFASIGSMYLFVINNRKLRKKLDTTESNWSMFSSPNVKSHSLLGILGAIVNEEREEDNSLYLECTYVGELESFNLDKYRSIFAVIAEQNPKLSSASIQFVDLSNEPIALIRVSIKSMIESIEETGWRKVLRVLMIVVTSHVDCNIPDCEYTTCDDREFIYGTLKLLMPSLERLKQERQHYNEVKHVNIENCRDIVDDINFTLEIANEYLRYSQRAWLIEHLIELLSNLAESVNRLVLENDNSLSLLLVFNVFSHEMNRVSEFIGFLGNMKDEKKFFRRKTTAGVNAFKNVKVNDKCPCGSNIKYKKCCKATVDSEIV